VGRSWRTVASLLLLLGSSCKGRGWSAAEVEQFYGICGGGRDSAMCRCLAEELPKQLSFADYSKIVAATRAVQADKLDEQAMRKMARASAACAKPEMLKDLVGTWKPKSQ
jgi:hypothetical protein